MSSAFDFIAERVDVGGWLCEDRVLDGPASGEKVSKSMNQLDCTRGKGVKHRIFRKESRH